MKRLLIILFLSVPVLSFAQKSVRYRADVELNPGLGLIQMGAEQAEDFGYEIPLRYLYAGAGLGTVQGIEIKDRIFLGAGLNIIGSAVFNGNGSSTAGFGFGLFLHGEYAFGDADSRVRPFASARFGFKGCEGLSSPTWTLGGGIRIRNRLDLGLNYSLGRTTESDYDSETGTTKMYPLLCHIPYLRIAYLF